MTNETRLLALIADLRAALGVGETVMQDELVERAREIRQGFDRYKKVICLTPADFAQLKKIAFLGKTKFDTLIDNLNLPN